MGRWVQVWHAIYLMGVVAYYGEVQKIYWSV